MGVKGKAIVRAPLPPLKSRATGVLDADAECRECPWATNSRKNAMGLGAQHAMRTGHEVIATQTIVAAYNSKPKGTT